MSVWNLNLKRVTSVAAAALLAMGCASILGIESDRDTAGNYPEGGYEGCQDGDCDGCITVDHEEACREGTNGGNNNSNGNGDAGMQPQDDGGPGNMSNPDAASPLDTDCTDINSTDECALCVCDNCDWTIDTCNEFDDCRAIFDCMKATRCEIGSGNEDGCYRPANCKSVIDANGGLFGEAFSQATDIGNCITSAGCPCSANPSCMPGTQECDGCPGLCARCVCENGANSPVCDVVCFDAQCRKDINDCADCSTPCGQCLCMTDGFRAPCEETCSQDLPCTRDDDCAECDSFLGQCSCETEDYNQCILNEPEIGLDCGSPFTEYDACLCKGTAEGCRDVLFGESCDRIFPNGDWRTCACDRCPLQFTECIVGDLTCMYVLMPCLVDSSPDYCQEYLPSAEGTLAMAYAEALRQCMYDSGCEENDPDHLPFAENCNPGTIDEICFGDPGDVVPGTTIDGCCLGPNECGLRLDKAVGRDQGLCQRFGDEGYIHNQCPSLRPNAGPYRDDYELQGCCRFDNSCGFYDDVYDLGCVPAETFGIEPTGCSF